MMHIIVRMSTPNKKIFMLLAILISLTGALGSTASGEGGPRARTRCKEAERHALLEIKENLHGRDVGFLSSWGIGDERRECCEWIGIRCDNKSGSVIRLDFSPSTLGRYQDRFLEGNLSSSLVDLHYLQYLDLSYINFYGNSIPSFIGSLSKLRYLNLSYTYLSGKVPPQLGNLSSLQFLDLSETDLEIKNMEWASHLSSLQLLDLSSTNMSFAHDWVHVVNNLPHLKILKLGASHLPDTVPLSLSFVNSSTVLAIIDLSSIPELSSSIFQWLFNYSHSLVHLDLSSCALKSSIPEAFENMAALEYLDLWGNRLDGSIPRSFGNMTTLEHLDLSWNELEGSIPQSFGNMTTLEYLDLSHNGLDGSIPQSFGNMTALEHLDLSKNGLDGSIPQSFGNMTALSYLDLSRNGLDGSIPQSFGNMTALEYLDLSSNKLEGEIPKSIWRVCTLWKLRADDNSLAGELHLAESSTRCANFPLEELDLGNNQIMGSLPNFTLYPSLITLSIGSNKLDGNVSKSIWQLSKLEDLDISENFVTSTISEAHFSKLINLRFLDLSSNSKIVFEISPDWIPPFQLKEISLGSVNLGHHFPKWLQTQKSYSLLDISNSGITGSIPDWFWTNLSTATFEISLNLSNNGISTLVHDSEGINFHESRFKIDLSSNQLEGSIPLFLLQVATSLYLLDNKFSGLNSICNATQSLPLVNLDVSNNQLSGELSDCWSYAEHLVILNLKNNSLTGKIPISIGSLSWMVILRLTTNHLIGKLPSSLKNCTLLSVLDVGENKLSGQIPAWIGKSANLIVLSIRSNNFYGSIPSQLCHLQGLQLLDLSSNWLSSGIPTCLGNITAMKEIGSDPGIVPFELYNGSIVGFLPPIENDKLRLEWKGLVREFKNVGLLRNIDLSSNKLIGEIPKEVTELVGLVSLNLSRNNLSGEIPQRIGELKSLDVLDLSKNHLSGRIPSSLSQVSRLSTLDLSNNNLSGKIPTGTQLQTRDAATYFGNPELCGDPLSKNCPGEDEPTTSRATEDHGDDQDDEDKLITKGFYISSAVGFIVAFWGFCLALIFNKSWRYSYLKSLNKAEDWVYVTVAVNKTKLLRIIKS